MAEPFCAEQSLAAGESLAGTAVNSTDRWIVLEYERPWAAKAFEDSELPPAVKQRLVELVAAVPRARIQLIRRPGCEPTGRPACFLGYSGASEPHLRKLPIEGYDDLLDIDLMGWARGEQDLAQYDHGQPLYLVCVHGKRDRCCARLGMPLFQRLAALSPDDTWQTSHLGGHRFAATMLSLPDGLCYGRLQPEEADDLLKAHRAGEAYRPERMRGRTCFDAQVQTAEVLARSASGEQGLVAPRVRSVQEQGAAIEVELSFGNGAIQRVQLHEKHLAPFTQSCGKSPKPAMRLVPLEGA